jgi:hypothetical protein
MKSTKKQKQAIAQYICELLAENDFVAFTRTPKGVNAPKQMQKTNVKAMDRLTIQTKETIYVRK